MMFYTAIYIEISYGVPLNIKQGIKMARNNGYVQLKIIKASHLSCLYMFKCK